MGLFGGSSNVGAAIIDAGGQNYETLAQLQNQGMAALNEGRDAATGYLKQAQGAYAPLSALGQKGANLYADALGVNGATGNANATSAFKTGPGYQFNMDQGLQALERRAAAQGRLQSGNTSTDTMDYATGLASQEYGGWLDRLSGYNGMMATGAAGEAGAYGSMAGVAQGDASQRVGLLSDVAGGWMGATNQIASAIEARNAAKEKEKGGLLGLAGKAIGGALGGISGGPAGMLAGAGKGLLGYGGF